MSEVSSTGWMFDEERAASERPHIKFNAPVYGTSPSSKERIADVMQDDIALREWYKIINSGVWYNEPIKPAAVTFDVIRNTTKWKMGSANVTLYIQPRDDKNLRKAVAGFESLTNQPRDDKDLRKAFSDFESLTKMAQDEELPTPDPIAVSNARELLPKLYDVLPVRYRISPTDRAGVAIDTPMRWGASVSVECAPSNRVYCFVAIVGKSRRAKFYQMDGLPDGFIRDALRDFSGS